VDPWGSTGSEGDPEQARKIVAAAVNMSISERIMRYLRDFSVEAFSPAGNYGILLEMPGPDLFRPAAAG